MSPTLRKPVRILKLAIPTDDVSVVAARWANRHFGRIYPPCLQTHVSKTMAVGNFSNFTTKIDEFTKKPEKYLSLQEAQAEEIKRLTEELYNFTKKNEQKNKTPEVLPRLVIRNLDEEQIWQQIELQNNSFCNKVVSDIAHLLAKKDLTFSLVNEKSGKKFCYDGNNENDSEESCNASESGVSSNISDNDISSKASNLNSKIKPKKVKPSIVDDKFFKLHEMEEFLENAEKEKDDDIEEDLYYFQDSEQSDDEEGLHYNDFFDQPDDELLETNQNNKKVKFAVNEEKEKGEDDDDDYDDDDYDDDDEEEYENKEEEEKEQEEVEKDKEVEDNNLMENKYEYEDNVTKQPSTFEARQERLKSRIRALESAALREKPWQLKGEVTASSRPQNSLLEEYVEFDIATRPAPVLTEKSTLKLEDIILQRIKDKAWDDVVRKIKPTEHELEYKKKLVLDQEKSKLSLAQIYEQEYLNQLDKKNESVIDKPEVEAPEHKEIRIMMNKLFAKLDALSNFHFTPKQVKEDVTIISNVPAIQMEEVAPVATSDAALLAPEEVKPKSKGELIGKSERTSTDKKRERRQKKIKQKLKYKQMEAKEKEELGKDAKEGLNKNISQKLLQKITKNSNVVQLEQTKGAKHITSSKAFFSKLQDKTSGSTNRKLDLKKLKLEKKLQSKKRKTS